MIFPRLVVMLLLIIVASAKAEEKRWFDGSLVGMEIGPTGAQFGYSDPHDLRYCQRFDGREIVRQAVAAGSQYLVMWARDGDYAYYDSQLLPKAPGLGDRDPLREVMDAARKHGLPVIAYCVVQQGGHFLQAHPEYAMRGADGQRIGRFCYNSGYLSAMQQILSEQLAYGLDGFHIDMIDQGFGPPYGCWCDTCRQQFQERYDRPMPAGVTWDEDWDRMLEFRYATSAQFEQALTAHVRAVDPRVSVDFNYHGNPPFSFEVGQRPVQHAAQGDFVTGETGVWGFSALTVGLNAEFYRAAAAGRRFQVAMQRGVRMYHDQTTRPLLDIRWELMTLLSHGAFVTMVDKTGFDGSLDPVAYERIGAAFAEAIAKREHFGQPPVADVGLYFSHRTRDWHARENPARYFQSFQGAHKALTYGHVPYGVVLDENLSLERLQQFPVIMLPGVTVLSSAEVELLRRYVEQGGHLLVTGWSGCADRWGEVAGGTALEALIGARLAGVLPSDDNWVAFPDAPGDTRVSDRPQMSDGAWRSRLTAGIRPDWPFLVMGPAAVYQPTTAASYGELWRPHRTLRQQRGEEGTDWPLSAEEAVGPAALWHRLGQGQVLTLACAPGFATAGDYALVEARRLLCQAVGVLHPRPPVSISAPANVQSVVTDDPASQTLRIHLLGYFPPPQTTPARNRPYALPALLEDMPRYTVRVTLGRPVRRAAAFHDSTILRHHELQLEAQVEEVHEVLVINY